MLRSLKALQGYTGLAKDAYIGTLDDFYFHDDTWTIRYLVMDTGHWLPGRKVLVTTRVVGKLNRAAFAFPVSLTREQVKNSPTIDTDKPLLRQHEVALHRHYGWPFYWAELTPKACSPYGRMVPDSFPAESTETNNDGYLDQLLHSAKQVAGYYLNASDGALGHVEDLIAEEERWLIRYLVVHTGMLAAKKVLIPAQWLGEINYPERQVHVTLTREKILKCPEFFTGPSVSHEYEERLYDYYGRPAYSGERELAEPHPDGGIKE